MRTKTYLVEKKTANAWKASLQYDGQHYGLLTVVEDRYSFASNDPALNGAGNKHKDYRYSWFIGDYPSLEACLKGATNITLL